MIELTEAEIAWVREWVGDEPDDSTLLAIINQDDVQTKELLVRRVLNTRLANLLAEPADLNVPGEISINTTANIKALQDKLAGLPTVADVSGSALPTVVTVDPIPRPR